MEVDALFEQFVRNPGEFIGTPWHSGYCVESHLRDAVENGFEVLTVTDATAAAGEEALQAALTNFGFIAHETATIDEVVDRLVSANES